MDNEQKIDKLKTSFLCALCGSEEAEIYLEPGSYICKGHIGAAELKSHWQHIMNLLARLDSVNRQIEESELGILKKQIKKGIGEAEEQLEILRRRIK
jgi:hypothetical protein